MGRKGFTIALPKAEEGDTANLYSAESQKFKTTNLKSQNKADKMCIRSNIKLAEEVRPGRTGSQEDGPFSKDHLPHLSSLQ